MTSLRERLEARCAPEPNTGCFLWTGSTIKGYGQIGLGNQKLYAHRVSYELNVGKIPEGLCVLHRCDMPTCVNPAHLWLGTRADNLEDMTRKGRRFRIPKGGANWSAKLTWEQADAIRTDTRPKKEITAQYGISRGTVRSVQAGRTWMR